MKRDLRDKDEERMRQVGTVESVWRYPIKSMRGEALAEAFFAEAGVEGDRICPLVDSAAASRYLTGRERPEMLLYHSRLRMSGQECGGGDAIDVETPSGQLLTADDPTLLAALARQDGWSALGVIYSARPLTDCRPVSLISLNTIAQIGAEVDLVLDKRRFRANVYVQLNSCNGFSENELVGRNLQIGKQVALAVLERDLRCRMIGIDPATAKENLTIPRKVARSHGSTAGVYCNVLKEGTVRPGDAMVLID
jgi:uncharacterized protein YcbX